MSVEYNDPLSVGTIIAVPSVILIGVSIIGFYLASTITCKDDATCKEKKSKFRQGYICLSITIFLIVVGVINANIPFQIEDDKKYFKEYEPLYDENYKRFQPLLSSSGVQKNTVVDNLAGFLGTTFSGIVISFPVTFPLTIIGIAVALLSTRKFNPP